MKQITRFKHKSLTAVLATALGLIYSSAGATNYTLSGDFIMFDGTGAQVGVTDSTLTGGFDSTNLSSMTINSTQFFFGLPWTAHNLVIDQTSGFKSYDTIQGPALTGQVNSGQWIVHMLFDWSSSTDIDVINVWNVTYNTDGSITLQSTDVDLTGAGDTDTIPGAPMVDGPFVGFNANFNLTLTPPFLTDLTTSQGGTQTSTLDAFGGNITVDSGVAGATSYDWSSSDAALLAAATGGTNNQTLIIDPAVNPGSPLNGPYTARVTVVSGADSLTVPLNFTITAFNFGAVDTDGDGTNDDVEGAGDTDGDGIPNFLDNNQLSAQEIALSTGSVITTGSGTLSIGNVVSTRGVASLATNASNPELAADDFLPELTVAELGADDKVIESCIGSCYEFRVRGLSAGDSAQVTIPLSTEIPVNAVYRKSVSGDWKGYKIDADNNIASAPATSTGPTVCPAPGSAAYTSGLTPGHFCIQLTLNDGGANDAEGQANGTIVDPGGVASTDQFNPENVGAVDSVGGGWWLLLGLPVMVAMRRLS